jgi:multidrug efflux pump subunit AcrA (membrane-fusion protein)
VIFDAYSARLRGHQADKPEDPHADEILVHDVDRVRADQAIADVDRRETLIALGRVAQDAGVRVSIELHRLPPEASPRG